MIKSKKRARDNYVLRVSSVIEPGMKLLDIGCGKLIS